MSQVNFLPMAFIQAQRRQRRVFREFVLVAVVVMTMLGWFVSSHRQMNDLEGYANAVHAEAQAARRQVIEMVKLRDQHQQLTRQVHIQRELTSGLQFTFVVSTIATLMPESMTLSNLIFNAPRVVPTTKKAVTSNDSSRASRPTQQPAPILQIELIGVAPNDVDIANFVGKLAENPLFVNVKMLYSRSTEIGKLAGREFRIEMQVPLDRDYKASSQREEVARAD